MKNSWIYEIFYELLSFNSEVELFSFQINETIKKGYCLPIIAFLLGARITGN